VAEDRTNMHGWVLTY